MVGLNRILSDGPPDEVKIRLKHGEWEVEITCAESRVRQVVENVLSSLDSKAFDSVFQSTLESMRVDLEKLKSRVGQASSLPSITESKSKGGKTCRGLLDSLWQDSYFASEKALAEVHEELGRRGYNYDRTAVSHSLADMVRESFLTRTGTMRNFRYIQKRPPGG